MIRRPPRSTQSRSSAASDVYKRQAGNFANVSCTTESQQNHKRITKGLLPKLPRPGPSNTHTKRNKKHLARGAPQQSHGRNTQILLCGITKVLGPTGLDVQKLPNRGMATPNELQVPGFQFPVPTQCLRAVGEINPCGSSRARLEPLEIYEQPLRGPVFSGDGEWQSPSP